MLFPWRMTGFVRGAPVFLAMPGSRAVHVPCFAEETPLRAFMARAGLTFDRIKRIDDGDEFLDSLPREHGGAAGDAGGRSRLRSDSLRSYQVDPRRRGFLAPRG
jgi:hypothetical protein